MPAEWARREAIRRGRPSYDEKAVDRAIANWEIYPSLWIVHKCLAEMIEKHEKPPVDPDLVVVRKFMAERSHDNTIAACYMKGDYDHFNSIRLTLAAYKLGKASE